jgi:hypothetical protein
MSDQLRRGETSEGLRLLALQRQIEIRRMLR